MALVVILAILRHVSNMPDHANQASCMPNNLIISVIYPNNFCTDEGSWLYVLQCKNNSTAATCPGKFYKTRLSEQNKVNFCMGGMRTGPNQRKDDYLTLSIKVIGFC